MLDNSRFAEAFGIRYPIVQAPMGEMAGAPLARATADAGALGLLGGAYGDKEWLNEQLDQLDPKGTGLPTGVGCGFITWALAKAPSALDILLERRPAAVFLSFGDPAPFADRVLSAGVPLICQVGNLEEARQALDVGASAVVAQGGEAGGHGLGVRSTLTFVPEVADLVESKGLDTFVLAAGGIADGRGLAAALMLGADGVVVGTRFWASEEAAVSPRAQDAAVRVDGDSTIRQTVFDLLRSKDWPRKYTGRVLNTKLISAWHGREEELVEQLDDVQREYRLALENEDYEAATVIVGESVSMVKSVQPAGRIVETIAGEAAKRLRLVSG